ncbi:MULTISPECIES: M16 family metallopeptidase [Sanguibacteroides]|uniref:Uncharacterized protein n=1 Tax=Sanguibacteroides justesenii TaxID=1547597 RepID=A0A0C3R5D2_9PORP|nr:MULTISPECIES: insulinase family protein [Sanguibacteroides]KIO43115.1 hypothetical protein IE90_12950 [Sanguibacteroides justesenii]KIO44830.1 hypothetical protein BA92_07350 [Sanguibacteroides justesenii]PXZ43045.1 insulinase family protein [Sanguibacteroides justesenii]
MRKMILLFLLGLVQGNLFAQYAPEDTVPLNPAVRYGRLSNGLTYYVCRNTAPRQRADFYIVQNVGSLMENDDQNGLAHFLEHMAFNGTEHFPGDAITEVLKRNGVDVSSHLNAATGYNETVYRLSNIPTQTESLLDTCLLILHDWSRYISLDQRAIDKERKVVLEEARTTSGMAKRLSEKTMPVLLKGSKYAKRNTIGDPDVIKNFKRQALADYYHEWYRTDLQAIIVVGDFDAEWMEKKVIDLFSKIPVIENPTPRPFYQVPLSGKESYVLAVDKDVPYSFVSLNILSEAVKPEWKNHHYMRETLVEALYGLMFQTRIGKLTQQKNSPCLAADSKMAPLVRGYRAYVISTTANLNQEGRALEKVYAENERLKRYGFTTGELEKAKQLLLMSFKTMYENLDKIENSQLVAEFQAHFLENEPAPGFDYYYRFAESVIPTITVEEVSNKAKKWITRENMVVSIAGPKNAIHLTKGDALNVLKKVEKMEMEPYAEERPTGDKELITGNLKGGKIVKTTDLPAWGAEEWVLNNGARILFRKADGDKNQVVMTAYSKGGTSLFGPDLLPAAMMLGKLMPAYGIGAMSRKELMNYLIGKNVSIAINLNNVAENISGSSTPQSLETLMQLFYLTFEQPRFDKVAHELMMQQAKASLQTSPMSDSLQMILNDYNPRVILYNQEFLDKVTLANIEKVYRDRIQDASDFTFFIVGDVDAGKVRPLVEKYIGSIRSVYRREHWKDNGVRCPQGVTRKVIERRGEVDKSAVVEVYSKEMAYTVRDNYYFGIFQHILRLRCTRSIREGAGGTYNVSVEGSSQREPYPVYNLSISFDCDPDRAEELKRILFHEIDRMIKEGPTQAEIVQIAMIIRNQHEQSKLHNSYWLNVLTMMSLYGIDVTDPKNFSEIVDYLTPEHIRNFAERFFTDANRMDIVFETKKR